MDRTDRRFRITKATSAAGGALAALVASPAFAASGMTLQNVQAAFADFTLREWLLAASLLLLLIALVARLASRRRETGVDRTGVDRPPLAEDAPDLRWWRNPLPQPSP